ncbi:hypothetical protein ACJIZ3_014724 [Penstemon smallii]|uniref:Uncharacterized protein n=1 Tax=Penstemon smallii TaxID=265156 RepID=A0ABD3RNK6_9LAMI
MGSKSKFSKATAVKDMRRRSLNSSRKISKPQLCHRRTTQIGGATSVSEKMEALKNLIPSQREEIIKTDQLFQETADYIIHLKTQVFVLQKLIDFYGSSQPQENPNHV